MTREELTAEIAKIKAEGFQVAPNIPAEDLLEAIMWWRMSRVDDELHYWDTERSIDFSLYNEPNIKPLLGEKP